MKTLYSCISNLNLLPINVNKNGSTSISNLPVKIKCKKTQAYKIFISYLQSIFPLPLALCVAIIIVLIVIC